MKEVQRFQRIDPSELGLPLDRRGRISWRQISTEEPEIRNQMIEAAGRKLIATGVSLSQLGLSRSGLSGFVLGVSQLYPDSFRGLRQSLGLPQLQRPLNYWKDISRIENEALRAVEAGIELNILKLSKAGFGDLAQAIRKYYPGKYHGLREKFGLVSKKKPNGFWNPEKIEVEAKQLYEMYGVFSRNLLDEVRRGDLLGAIKTHYPGGFRTLLEYLGVPVKKPVGYWTPERIEDEYRRIAKIYNDSSLKVLRQKRPGLITLIYDSYPGGLYAIREKLGYLSSKKPNNYWTPELIESEVREFYQQYGKIGGNFFKKKGRSDLCQAVNRNYPGGLTAIYELFGISPTQKPKGFWKPEIIEEEARRFFEEYGSLSSTLLEENRSDLNRAIKKYYPGRLSALRKNLGIPEPDKSPSLSSEAANQWLMELVGEEKI